MRPLYAASWIMVFFCPYSFAQTGNDLYSAWTEYLASIGDHQVSLAVEFSSLVAKDDDGSFVAVGPAGRLRHRVELEFYSSEDGNCVRKRVIRKEPFTPTKGALARFGPLLQEALEIQCEASLDPSEKLVTGPIGAMGFAAVRTVHDLRHFRQAKRAILRYSPIYTILGEFIDNPAANAPVRNLRHERWLRESGRVMDGQVYSISGALLSVSEPIEVVNGRPTKRVDCLLADWPKDPIIPALKGNDQATVLDDIPREAAVIKRKTATYFVDVETLLPVRVEKYTHSGKGVTETVDVNGYIPHTGVLYPSQVVITSYAATPGDPTLSRFIPIAEYKLVVQTVEIQKTLSADQVSLDIENADQIYNEDTKELLIRRESLDAYGENVWQRVDTSDPDMERFEP